MNHITVTLGELGPALEGVIKHKSNAIRSEAARVLREAAEQGRQRMRESIATDVPARGGYSKGSLGNSISIQAGYPIGTKYTITTNEDYAESLDTGRPALAVRVSEELHEWAEHVGAEGVLKMPLGSPITVYKNPDMGGIDFSGKGAEVVKQRLSRMDKDLQMAVERS